ncbi:MAG: hypothetical protein RLZZ383_2505 [Pseudomonadota bacterium]|jgi:hypothetical protein
MWTSLVLLVACGGLAPLPTDTGSGDTLPPSADSGVSDTPPDADTPTDTPADTPALDTSLPAPDETGAPAVEDSAGDSDPPLPPAWSHTIIVDGSLSDWFPTESVLTSAGGSTALRVTWDATALYLATTQPDVLTGGPNHWFVVYLGDDAVGATSGLLLNTQQPAFQRPMRYALRRKADGSYDSLHDATSGTWDAGVEGWLSTAGAAAVEAGDTLEIALPWSAFTLPERFTLIAMWVYEGAGFESTYAVSPHDAVTPPPPAVYDVNVDYPLDFFRTLGP